MSKKTVSSEDGNPFTSLKNLWPYMWPSGRMDLKRRIVLALGFLLLSKLILLSVPFFFKWATDALNGNLQSDFLPPVLLAPIMLVIAYNIARLAQWGFNQLRDAFH